MLKRLAHKHKEMIKLEGSTASSSGEKMHLASSHKQLNQQKPKVHLSASRRSCRRGVYFRDVVWSPLVSLSDELGLSVSALVNLACETWLAEKLTGSAKERFLLEAEVQRLMDEERGLREKLTVILRSGTYLPEYAHRLLLGDKAEIDRLSSRKGSYAQMSRAELDVVLRVLARREAISKRLVEVMDKVLPKTRYPLQLTEKGWKIKPKGGEQPRQKKNPTS